MASKPSKPAKKTSSKVAARKSTAAKVENKKSAVDALPLAGAEALVAFMADFQQRHG